MTGTNAFSALDGSAQDHDGAVNGVFTVSDGDLVVNGVVNCNDDSTESACSMAFNVSGDLVINAGGALYAENRSGGGTGGAITLTVGQDLLLSGNAIVSTASKSSSGANGGAISATVGASVSLAAGTTIDSGSANGRGGAITVNAQGGVSVDGNVLSGPSRTLLATRLTATALDGGSSNSIGGVITISSSTFVEPALVVGSNASIVSQGGDGGAGPVTLEGCGIQIKGLVASLGRKDSATKVSIRSGKDLLVDARDLGVTGATLGRNGRVRADATSGTSINRGVDLFAAETIQVLGPAAASSSLYPLTALAGLHDAKSVGGLIRLVSTGDAVHASGNVIDDGRSAAGDTGGPIEVAAKSDVLLNTAVIRSFGDSSTNNPARGGGSIAVRSYSGNVIWTNGLGDVRPTGSASSLPLSDQGTITLTACGTVDTTGSSFPVNGSPTGVWPVVTTGACSPAAPSLPAGVTLVTCNTPPVANDASASTNEDTSVSITLSGTDADGDSLTFSIVSGPFNGTLGAIVQSTPTSATVVYTPNSNYNGGDSFVYQANDGNGGTDNANVTIAIAPVNDAPSFQIGATDISLEDAGPQIVPNWVSAISAGPADESGQTVTFTVTYTNPSLFSVAPSVDASGTLTYTAAANAYGSSTITVTAQDNGGTANGGVDTSASQTSQIDVTPVNDAPSFTKGADQTVAEDSGAQSVANWATGISAGPNEGSQTVSFVLSNDNSSLFSAQPAVDASGTLTYTPAANANGSATVTIYAQDDGGTANGGVNTSASQSFTISVTAVNDAPSFTSGGDVTVDEDSGAYSAAWATDISAGPADESGQSLTFNVSNSNNALFSVQPAIDASGVLTFTLAADQFGSATVTVTLTDGGGASSAAQTFSINVNNVNDAPTFTAGGNVSVNEDSGAYSATWATAISAGPNESGQTLTFNVSNDNNALFSAQPAISASGTLTYTPAANAFGSATVTVTLSDDGTGNNTSAAATFTITVNAVNDAPSFAGSGNVTVDEDSGAYSAPWATTISAGPANESGQTVAFFVSNSNASLFSSQPAIDANGILTFATAPNANGTATVTVYAQDNGGTANGGVDTSASQTFTITVVATNDVPSFTPGGNVSVNEDSGPYAAQWATNISAGQGEIQPLTFTVTNDNNALFTIQPALSPTGILTFTPAPNAYGVANVTVTLSDGIDSSAPVVFTITVVDINDLPIVNNESYDTIGNTMLQVAGTQTASAPVVFVSGNLLANDNDPDGGPSPLTTSLSVASPGATVVVNPDGTFTYVPPAGHPGATDQFQYAVSDGSGTTIGTVTITIKGRVWYVDNTAAAGGTGRSHDRFDTLAEAETASVTGDHVYVFNGDGTASGNNAGITLKANQRLLGAGVALDVPVSVNGGASPTILLTATANRSMIGNAGGNGVTINGVSGVEVAGLNIAGSSHGVSVIGASATANIHHNTVRAAGVNGIGVQVAGAATITIANNDVTSTGSAINMLGGPVASTVVINDNAVKSTGGHGINVEGSQLTVAGFSGNSVSGDTFGTGIRAVLVTFNAVNGGNTTVGSAGNGVGQSGVVLANANGSLSFNNLSVVADGGAGLSASSAGSLSVSTAAGSISATGGPAVSGNQVTFGLALAGLSSTNSASEGVSLIGVAGTVSAAAGSISGAAAEGFEVTGGTVSVSYGGSITSTSQNVVSVTNHNTGSLTFSGAITATGANAGVELLTNTGSVSFTGSSNVNTSTGAAFRAVNGGTLSVTGGPHVLATTTGTALTVDDTTIAGSGITFRSVSANGAVNGIFLRNTGALGGLSVTGNGAAGTGGTIQSTTSYGVSLTNTMSPSFNYINVQSTARSGIFGTSVVNFTLTNSAISNSGSTANADDANVDFYQGTVGAENNLSGVVTITNNTLSNAPFHGIDIFNRDGVITNATISNNMITSSTASASSLGSGIRLLAFGTATSGAQITKATINQNEIKNFPTSSGMQVQCSQANAGGPAVACGSAGSATSVVRITNNLVTGASAVSRIGAEGIIANMNGIGSASFEITGNTIRYVSGTALSSTTSGLATATATITGNTIEAYNAVGATGIGGGVSQTFAATDTPTYTMNVSNNNISRTDGNGILLVARSSTGTLKATVQNNVVAAPLSSVRQGIRIDSGNAVGNATVCLTISGNTSAGSGGAKGIGLRKQGTNPAINAFGINGNPATGTPGVEAYVDAQNPAGSGTTLISATTGFTSCTP